MSSPTRLADDYDAIRARIAELEAEKKAAEAPKAWPSYAAADQDCSGLDVAYGGMYVADDYDPA